MAQDNAIASLTHKAHAAHLEAAEASCHASRRVLDALAELARDCAAYRAMRCIQALTAEV